MFFKEVVSINELENAAREIISSFKDLRVFAFYGKMGAGKTTFIKAVCKVLGSDDYITSPTFALVNEYFAGSNSVYHFDFYRIKEIEEVYDLGYEEYFYSGNYCLIEWPEKIESLLPPNRVEVIIEVKNNETRTISAHIT